MYQNKVILIGFLGDNKKFAPTTTAVSPQSRWQRRVPTRKKASTSRTPNGTVSGLRQALGVRRHAEEGCSSAGGRPVAQPRVRNQEGRQETSREEDHLGDPGELNSQAGPGPRSPVPTSRGGSASGGSGRISRFPLSIREPGKRRASNPVRRPMNTQITQEFLTRRSPR